MRSSVCLKFFDLCFFVAESQLCVDYTFFDQESIIPMVIACPFWNHTVWMKVLPFSYFPHLHDSIKACRLCRFAVTSKKCFFKCQKEEEKAIIFLVLEMYITSEKRDKFYFNFILRKRKNFFCCCAKLMQSFFTRFPQRMS